MTKEEVKTFVELYDKFIEDCKRVRIVMDSVYRNKYSIYYANTYRLKKDKVLWYGERTSEYPNEFGDFYTVDLWGSFPIEYLSMSDEVLREAVIQHYQQELEEW